MKNLILNLRAGLTKAALGSLLITACAAVSAQQTITVGATVPITGPLSLTGMQYFNSLKLAEEDINKAGGIKGAKVAIVVEDACRGIDVAGSMAQTRHALAEVHIPCIAAETIG